MNKDWFDKRRGYFYVVFCALVISSFSTWKYRVVYKVVDSGRLWANFGILLIFYLIVGLLIARWYYKLKKRNNDIKDDVNDETNTI